MRKKFICALLCVTVVGSMLIGCGSSNTPGGETPEDTTREETPEEPVEGTDEEPMEDTGDSAGGLAAADGDIVYWSMWDAGSVQATAIEEIVAAYEEKSGNTVTIEFKGRDINTLIAASLDAGETIDLYEDDFQRLSQTFGEYALDLEDMAAAAGYGSMSNEALTSAVRGWAGSLKAIPFQPYGSGIFYNKAIFEQVGVTEPATWAEFLDVCEKIKAAGITPLALDDAYVSLNLGYHLARYIGQDGVKDVVDNGNWAENEGVLKMANDIEELYTKGYLSQYAPASYPTGENELGYEETAMLVNATWVPAEIQGNTQCDFEWGMFSYPAVDGGVDGTEAMMVGAQGMSISKNSKNAQAAFELAMMIVTGEGDASLAIASDAIPADPNNAVWPELIKNCKPAFDAATKSYEWACGIENNSDITTTIVEWGTKLFTGECTASQFVEGLEAVSK